MRGDGWVFRKRGRWWVGYYHEGKEHREPAMVSDQRAPQGKRPARDEEEALRVLRSTIRGLDKGERVTPDKRKLTVGSLLDSLLEWMKNQGKRSARTLGYHLKPVRASFGAVRAVALTSSMVERYKSERIRAGKAKATVNREIEGLRRAYSWGAEQTPPLVPHVSTIHRFHEDNTREGFLSRGDLEALLQHVTDQDVVDFIRWAYWSGMRKNEIAKLTWDAFDRETWTLRLPARSAKTKKGRALALEGTFRDIIQRRLDARRLDTLLIFHRVSKGKPGQPVKDFRKQWAAACRAVGIVPGRKDGVTFHDTRRTAVRNMVRAGVDNAVAKRISGHVTDSMFQRYNITDEADLADAVGKLEAYVSTLPTNRKVVAVMGGEPGPNPDRSPRKRRSRSGRLR